MIDELNKILSFDTHDPFSYLGAHFDYPEPGKVTLRTIQPHANGVSLVMNGLNEPMTKTHPEGMFEINLSTESLTYPALEPYNYQYEIQYSDNTTRLVNDPYRFLPQLGEQDRFLFNAGRNYRIYNHLGAHLEVLENISGTVFRVWAPNARAVAVVGDFNGWDNRVHQMRSLGASGIWELFIPQVTIGEKYKYFIKTQNNSVREKIDPFQFYGEIRPLNASIVTSLDSYQWQDDQWQDSKAHIPPYSRPVSIYELHPGSWRRDPKDPNRFLSYRELALHLIPYVKELGATHIELMPIMEHPLDESWGYQVTAPFSVTSRYGIVEDFMYFVDQCHQHEIGVILDWVPAHFPKDDFSLGKFDGTALFEHEDIRRGAHPEWGTYIYNYGRSEVSNFLIANALFWLDKFHIDGLRVDAVASMLYLDYSRKEGEWLPNAYGGKENLEAIEFIRHLNSIIFEQYPNTLMIAEESTSFYGVSTPTNNGGLGFGFKWNMGWMNDILDYFSQDPIYRKYHHNKLTFSLMYAFSENFILPLSHDEVVHGKRSLLDKMPGDTWQKFANLRLLLIFMWMHPGKKLIFMGAEFGQWLEWNCKQSLDWHLLTESKLHSGLHAFVCDLNRLYRDNKSLWEIDFSHEGFRWIDFEDRNNSIISFARYARNPLDHLVCIFNFTPQKLENYRIGLPSNVQYRQICNSDNQSFGGVTPPSAQTFDAEPIAHGQAQYSTLTTIPPLAGIILSPTDK